MTDLLEIKQSEIIDLTAKLDAARAALSAMPAPKVKSLVWEDMGNDQWQAKAPLFGGFRVENWIDSLFQAVWSVPGYCDTLIDGEFATADEAKAAIQDYCERRILSALVTGGSDE